MKKILLLTGVITLLTTSGCLVAEDRGGRHERHEGRGEVIVAAPVVVVPEDRDRHDRHD